MEAKEKATENEMLRVEGLQVYYGPIHAVKNVSFALHKGEIFALIGANGAGKSTILKTISGIQPPKEGKVFFQGMDITHMPPHKIVQKGLVQVPEGRRIFLKMTVKENLDMGAYTAPGNKKDALEKVYDYFPRLKERTRQVAGTLSGGEQQMLAMGRALMSHPTLMMLDEPSMGLAPLLVEEIFKIIETLHKAGVTILLVEQNAKKALELCDRACVLETGRLVLEGTGTTLMASPEVKKAYLGG